MEMTQSTNVVDERTNEMRGGKRETNESKSVAKPAAYLVVVVVLVTFELCEPL
jgi:hypothetical protein